MKVLGENLGSQVCESMLFIHAFSGCDTTSRLFDTTLNKCLISKIFQGCSNAFSDESSTADQVATAGANALVMLYGGKHEDNLNILRYMKF